MPATIHTTAVLEFCSDRHGRTLIRPSTGGLSATGVDRQVKPGDDDFSGRLF
jgi:hypothetical protein